MTETVDELKTPQHLKKVSRIKHIILQNYLPPWQTILGSNNPRLCYFDCYAGPGTYELKGTMVEGSPLIAVRAAKAYLQKYRGKKIILVLVEEDEKQRLRLEESLKEVQPYSPNLNVFVSAEDTKNFVRGVLEQVPHLVPTFFMVDPYGHPLSIPIINQILGRPHTEALITFMFYRINMDANNPKVQNRLDEMFGNDEWRHQDFLRKKGAIREKDFLEYFKSQIKAEYKLHFRIRYDVEDRMSQSRTKYYLVHASNHPKAALLMKEIMWPLGDEEGLFDYSGRIQDFLFSTSPKEEELKKFLLKQYAGKQIDFDQLRLETLDLPFVEKHYRSVLQKLRKSNVEIIPVTSKTDRGLRGKDNIIFLTKR